MIFDFDGVLADSEKWHFATYSEVFARHGHTIDETEYYKYWTSLGMGARGEIERFGLDLDPIAWNYLLYAAHQPAVFHSHNSIPS